MTDCRDEGPTASGRRPSDRGAHHVQPARVPMTFGRTPHERAFDAPSRSPALDQPYGGGGLDGFGGRPGPTPAVGAALQAKPDGAEDAAGLPAAAMMDAAGHGIQGGAGTLPHADAIQASFGRHDVGGIRAHTDASAADACGAMGAEAFATGSHVAFAGAPSLHTAAHEAAHVVQQRGGVSLLGGMGQEGDPYEQHADAVADAVVAGRSAEALLDVHADGKAGAGGGAVQRKITRDWSWNGYLLATWVDGNAKATWEDLDNRFNTQLDLKLRAMQDLAGKHHLPSASKAGGIKTQLTTIKTDWDGKALEYSKAGTLGAALDLAFDAASKLSLAAETEQEEHDRNELLRHQEEERARATELEQLKTRLGEALTSKPFLPDVKPPTDQRKRLVAEVVQLQKESRGWNPSEREALSRRILELETQFSECERQYNERVLPKKPKEDEATATAEPEVEVALSEKGKTLKKQQGQLFGQLSRSCDNDLSIINEICGAIGLGDLGRVNSALAMVTASEWLELQKIHGNNADELNRLLAATGAERFDDVKAMLAATPKAKVGKLIELVGTLGGDVDNQLVPVLQRPSADIDKVSTLVGQTHTDKLLPALARAKVIHTDIPPLLASASKADAAVLIEHLPDTKFLRQLEGTIADPLELRLLAIDLDGNATAQAAIAKLYTLENPPTKDGVYGVLDTKKARGLRTNAAADIATCKMSDLTGTGEQKGVKATVAHVRGGDAPDLTHARGAKFGDPFDNNQGRLPGVAGAGGYKEYYVEKDPTDDEFHGSRRIVVSTTTDHIYYTRNHYASFARLLV